MSISQSRILALLDESQSQQLATSAARAALQDLATKFPPDLSRELKYIILLYLQDKILPSFIKEAAPFKSAARRNIRIADKQRRVRLAAGIKPKASFTSFKDLGTKGISTSPVNTSYQAPPASYQEAKALDIFSPAELFHLYPNEAPAPSPETLDSSMWTLEPEAEPEDRPPSDTIP